MTDTVNEIISLADVVFYGKRKSGKTTWLLRHLEDLRADDKVGIYAGTHTGALIKTLKLHHPYLNFYDIGISPHLGINFNLILVDELNENNFIANDSVLKCILSAHHNTKVCVTQTKKETK